MTHSVNSGSMGTVKNIGVSGGGRDSAILKIKSESKKSLIEMNTSAPLDHGSSRQQLKSSLNINLNDLLFSK